MKLIDAQDDRWQAPAEAEAVQPAPGLLLTPAQWQAAQGTWPADVPVGLRIANTEDVEALTDVLPRIALVALEFPKWTDGRAYSQARLLRSRLRYRGEIRATGDVVVDMLPLLERTGFDAVCLRSDQNIEYARRALSFFEGHYQGDVLQTRPHFSRLAA